MKFLERIKDIRCDYSDIKHKFIYLGDLLAANTAPKKSGAYVFYTAAQSFIYPWEKSNVFYIGQTDNLQNRLIDTHKKHIMAVISEQRKGNSLYYPLYEYGASFGVNCLYCQTVDSIALEGELLARFATINGAIPVANMKHDNFWYRFPQIA